eukprot:1355607-Rhodomonas_salina.1
MARELAQDLVEQAEAMKAGTIGAMYTEEQGPDAITIEGQGTAELQFLPISYASPGMEDRLEWC